VCYGNICRSPYLAAVLSHALPDVEVSSAGFVGAGRTVPQHSHTIAARRRLDLSAHRSRILSRDLAATADLVIVMDNRQARSVALGYGVSRGRIVIAGDLDPRAGTTRAIVDPWHKDLGVFEASFARLDRCAEGLVTIITERRT
jgi:protein-tyrosine phosphatase